MSNFPRIRIPNSEFRIPESIAVVGASTRAAAFSVLRSGRQAFAADLFADADLAREVPVAKIAPYPEGLVDWLAATPCDAWLYTGALENRPDLVDRLAEIRPLLGNSGDALRRCRDPLLLQAAFSEHGLHFPETRRSCAGLPLDGSWLAKTYRGSSGSGVWTLDDEVAQRRAVDTRAYFQQRVEGRPAAAVLVLADRWTKTLGITAQWMGAATTTVSPFQYAGSLAIQTALPAQIHQQMELLAQVLAGRLHLRGVVGVDLVLDRQRAWVVEINPRYTASVEVVERIQGISAIEAHVAALRGEIWSSLEQAKPAGQYLGKAILYARRDVAIEPGFFRWAMSQAGHGLDSKLADIPAAGSCIPRGRPVLTVFAATDQADGDRFLRQRIAQVEAQLYGSSVPCLHEGDATSCDWGL